MIHNIPSQEARDRAVLELVRVLKPGGRIAMFDLLYTARYAEVSQRSGLTVVNLSCDLLWLMPCRTLLARRQNADDPKYLISS